MSERCYHTWYVHFLPDTLSPRVGERRGGGVGEERVGVEREGVIVGEWGSGGMHEAARDGWVWGWKICIRI